MRALALARQYVFGKEEEGFMKRSVIKFFILHKYKKIKNTNYTKKLYVLIIDVVYCCWIFSKQKTPRRSEWT